MKSAYIHIPFCEHICFYCDFNKVFIEGQPVGEYIEMLLSEMDLTLKESNQELMHTIYIGGGTPTSLSANQLDRLLTGINALFEFEEEYEFTIEANPGDLSKEKVEVMLKHGINRLSMGVQSFDEKLLKKIGRVHSIEDVYRSIETAQKAGLTNISIDLIFALPGQTLSDFKDSLDKALALNLPHYSIYSLILENKTIFYNLMRQGKLFLPGEDIETDMFHLAIDSMEKHGIKQYEICNYAKPGFESRHNIVYWENEPYYGFGAGAHGFLGDKRYRNYGPIQQYLAPLRKGQLPILEETPLSFKEQMEEEMFLGLRKISGVSKEQFQKKFGLSYDKVYGQVTTDLIEKGLIQEKDEFVSLTQTGLFIGNNVFELFLLDDELYK